MIVKHGDGTEHGTGVSVELTSDEVATAIDAWLVALGVSGPRTVTVNGALCKSGHVADWSRRFELARKVAEAVERDLVREIERIRGERDRLADRLEASQRNLEAARAQYSEMVRARNMACSIADDAAQLRDDAFEWLGKIDEIRKIGFRDR